MRDFIALSCLIEGVTLDYDQATDTDAQSVNYIDTILTQIELYPSPNAETVL
jgi:hypothetical protein